MRARSGPARASKASRSGPSRSVPGRLLAQLVAFPQTGVLGPGQASPPLAGGLLPGDGRVPHLCPSQLAPAVALVQGSELELQALHVSLSLGVGPTGVRGDHRGQGLPLRNQAGVPEVGRDGAVHGLGRLHCRGVVGRHALVDGPADAP